MQGTDEKDIQVYVLFNLWDSEGRIRVFWRRTDALNFAKYLYLL